MGGPRRRVDDLDSPSGEFIARAPHLVASRGPSWVFSGNRMCQRFPCRVWGRVRVPTTMGCTSPTSRGAPHGPSIGLLEIEWEACWVPVVNERSGFPLLMVCRSTRWNWDTKERLCRLHPTIGIYAGTNRRSMLGVKGQQEAGSSTTLDSGRLNMLDACC